MLMIILLLSLVFATAAASAPADAGSEAISTVVPEVSPVFTPTAPSIDGKLDDSCWKAASQVTGFVLNTDHKKAKQQTIVRVCYDAETLFLAFECMESRMGELKLDYDKDGQPVWQDDSVEIFIAPYAVADMYNYHHFSVNAAGARTYLKAEWPNPSPRWQAATTRHRDKWVAEIAIPFASLKPHGKNEDCWRINFCREEHPSNEASSWAPVPQWFKSFWKFGKLLQPQSGPRFTAFRSKLEPVASSNGSAGILTVNDLPQVPESAKVLIPEPYEVHKKRSGQFRLNRATKIIVGDKVDETDMRAAEEINQEIQRRLGYSLQIERAKQNTAGRENIILIGEQSKNSLVASDCKENRINCDKVTPGEEGYVIDVSENRILIAGSDRLGTFWGAQTLREMIRTGQGVISGITIVDKPAFHFRGVHLLASKDALQFHTKLIEEVLSRYKVNHIVLQTDKIDWASHPEVRDPNNFMPREDVTKLIEVARKHHITVTPLVQTLGHMEWVFRNKTHLDIAEDPGDPYAICPSKPESYEFLFDIVDEAYELFQRPEYFHAGLDEFDMRGKFPVDDECRKYGKHELFYRNALKVHNHLKRKSCKMMMWGDILTTAGFSEKIDKLPRDILINDWRYGPLQTYPTLDFFNKHGFQTVGCTWYDQRNIYNFSKDAAAKHIAGMMQTTWTGFCTEDVVMKEWPEQVYSYILSAAWAWNPNKPALLDLPYEPDAVFHALWKNDTGRKEDKKWFTVDLSGHTNISTADSGRKVGWLGFGRGIDLRQMPSGLVNLAGTPYRIMDWRSAGGTAILLKGPSLVSSFPSAIEGIKVGAQASALHFLHTTAFPDGQDVPVGDYRIRYTDGKFEDINLVYGKNIAAWNDSTPSLSYGLVWKGKTNGNGIARLRDFVWTNPHPDKTIEAIDFISAGTQAAPVLLAITGEAAES